MPNAIVTVILVLGLFSGWLYLMQPSMIFYPSRELVASPADWHFQYEDVSFRRRDGIGKGVGDKCESFALF